VVKKKKKSGKGDGVKRNICPLHLRWTSRSWNKESGEKGGAEYILIGGKKDELSSEKEKKGGNHLPANAGSYSATRKKSGSTLI